MSLELLDAHETDEGMAVTFATERGIERVEGSPDEMARLARAMQQVAALGALNEHERVWIEEVAVGRSLVKLGLSPGGQARVMILHDARRAERDPDE
jgi:DNA-binding IclR family transcriptional regulator